MTSKPKINPFYYELALLILLWATLCVIGYYSGHRRILQFSLFVIPFLNLMGLISLSEHSYKPHHRHSDVNVFYKTKLAYWIIQRDFWKPSQMTLKWKVFYLLLLILPGSVAGLALFPYIPMSHLILSVSWWFLAGPVLILGSSFLIELFLIQALANIIIGLGITLISLGGLYAAHFSPQIKLIVFAGITSALSYNLLVMDLGRTWYNQKNRSAE